MNNRIVGIYCYRDIKTGKIVYVGKDSYIEKDRRHKDHMRPYNYDAQPINRVLQNNPDRYKYEVISKGEYSQKVLNNLEIVFINMYSPRFNFTTGGDGGYVCKYDCDNNEIIKFGKMDGKQVYGLKKNGEVVLTSTNRAEIFSAYFNLKYPINKIQ